jgi:hypothetical protein
VSNNLDFNESTNVLTVTDNPNVDYLINGQVINGEVELTKNTTVTARPAPGKKFARGVETSWRFEVNKDVVKERRSEAVESGKSEDSSAPKPADPAQTRVSGSGDLPSASGTTPSPGTSSQSPGAAGRTP